MNGSRKLPYLYPIHQASWIYCETIFYQVEFMVKIAIIGIPL